MAYQARRQKKLQEEFQLVDERGEVVKTLYVSLDADTTVVNINRKYAALTKSLYETNELRRKANNSEQLEECLEKLGRAVVNILEAVFGEEDTEFILQFYDNRYIEMTQEVMPFISEVVLPRLLELKKENQKTITSKYNRKQRRFLGLR